MIDLSPISLEMLQKAALIVVRVGTVFAIAPVMGSAQIPNSSKVFIGIVFALLLYPIIIVPAGVLPCSMGVFFTYILKEFLVGLTIGFITMLVISGIYLAGQVVDMQMGFAIVHVMDPVSNVQIPITGQFYFVMAVLIFLTMNGHHLIITALAKSFGTVPLGGFQFTGALTEQMIRYSADAWMIAFKIGAPSIGALFLTSVALGIIARTVPQMNIFIVGFPLKIALGLMIVAISLRYFLYFVRNFFIMMVEDVQVLIRLMAG